MSGISAREYWAAKLGEELHIGYLAVHHIWDAATNLFPLVVACWLYIHHVGMFDSVLASIITAFVAVVFAISPALWRKTDRIERTLEKIQPAFDKWCWRSMAAVLLLSGIDLMSRALLNLPIVGITAEEYQINAFPREIFNRLDFYSLLVGAMTILSPLIVGLIARYTPIKRTRSLRTLADFLTPILILVACVVAYKVLQNPQLVSAVDEARHLRLQTPDRISPAQLFDSAASYWSRSIDVRELSWASGGTAVFLFSYFTNGASLVDVAAHFRRHPRHWFTSYHEHAGDSESWRRQLRALIFEMVVLPPLIVSAALVSGTLDPGQAVVYGLFVYSGFSVWNLASNLVATRKRLGVWAVLLQFVYAMALTVLWSSVLAGLESFVEDRDTVFKAIFQVTVAAILIHYVYGVVYRNAFRSLSDRWLLEGPEFAVVATAICLVVGAVREFHFWFVDARWQLVCFIVLLLVLGPAFLLRRSVTAYVLIRTAPGTTGAVRSALNAAEISSSVVYGDYDIIARVELPATSVPILVRADADALNLQRLARIVKDAIRVQEPVAGVVATETLLDCTDHVPPESLKHVWALLSGRRKGQPSRSNETRQ
ncbi:hypothetical protein [Paraburkholderia sp. CI3]|uniref:hypothetical protein n=1 Tax=Paraburkholderia sp. CI3 TaxID=2991060 RepID=UPI003D24D9BD